MNFFLTLAFLFFIGSVSGWIMELFFRRFVSSVNTEKKWINPGFCTGPYLPLYGCGLCILYLIAQLEKFHLTSSQNADRIICFAMMAICMTLIEYITGMMSLKLANVRLWDYTKEWGNIHGVICPKFSLIWTILGAIYYFFIHPQILDALNWLSNNLAFSFFVGFFYGVFAIDVCMSAQIVAKLKHYAEENDVIVRYEAIKANIRKKHERAKKHYRFFRPFKSDIPLSEHIKDLKETFEKIKKKKN